LTGKDVPVFIFLAAERRASCDQVSHRNEPPDDFLWIRRVACFGFLGRSTTYAFHDLGKSIAGVGKAIDVVLALATAVNDSTVPQQSQVVADSRLAEVKLLA
jgi:hypothetical protein